MNPGKRSNTLKAACALAVTVVCGLYVLHEATPQMAATPIERDTTTLTRDEALRLAEKFAPVIKLFPRDEHRPSSVEHYFEQSVLKAADGKVLADPVTGEAMETNKGDNNYLEMKQSAPDAAHPRFTGTAAVHGKSSAPVYARVMDDSGDHWRIVYGVFFPMNGPQTLRAGYNKASQLYTSTHTVNFEWYPWARHESDWECVQVFVSKHLDKMTAVYGSQHGGGELHNHGVETSGGRPVMYSAWNSHAMYFLKQIVSLGAMDYVEFVAALNSIAHGTLKGVVAWIKPIDTTENTKAGMYLTSPDKDYVVLDAADNLVVTNGIEDTLPWLEFQGPWGPKMDNSAIERPPKNLPEGIDKTLYESAKQVSSLGQIPDDFLSAGGARGPTFKNWWLPALAPMRKSASFKNLQTGGFLSEWSHGRVENRHTADWRSAFELVPVAGRWSTYNIRCITTKNVLELYYSGSTPKLRFVPAGDGKQAWRIVNESPFRILASEDNVELAADGGNVVAVASSTHKSHLWEAHSAVTLFAFKNRVTGGMMSGRALTGQTTTTTDWDATFKVLTSNGGESVILEDVFTRYVLTMLSDTSMKFKSKSGASDQTWKAIDIGEGFFKLVGKNGKFLVPTKNHPDAGIKAVSKASGYNYQWKLMPSSSKFRFKNRYTKRWMTGVKGDVKTTGTGTKFDLKNYNSKITRLLVEDGQALTASCVKEGCKVITKAYDSKSVAQRWYIEYLGASVYVIRSMENQAMVMAPNGKGDGSLVVLSKYKGEQAKQWAISH